MSSRRGGPPTQAEQRAAQPDFAAASQLAASGGQATQARQRRGAGSKTQAPATIPNGIASKTHQQDDGGASAEASGSGSLRSESPQDERSMSGTPAPDAVAKKGRRSTTQLIQEVAPDIIDRLLEEKLKEKLGGIVGKMEEERTKFNDITSKLLVSFKSVVLPDGRAAVPDANNNITLTIHKTTWDSAYETIQNVTNMKKAMDDVSTNVEQHTTDISSLTARMDALESRLDDRDDADDEMAQMPRHGKGRGGSAPARSARGSKSRAGKRRRRDADIDGEDDDDEEMGDESDEGDEDGVSRLKPDLNAQNAFKDKIRKRMGLRKSDPWPAFQSESERPLHAVDPEAEKEWNNMDPALRGPRPEGEPVLRIDWELDGVESSTVSELLDEYSNLFARDWQLYNIPEARKSRHVIREALARCYRSMRRSARETLSPQHTPSPSNERTAYNTKQRRKRRRERRSELRQAVMEKRGMLNSFRSLAAVSEDETELDEHGKEVAGTGRLLRPAHRSLQGQHLVDTVMKEIQSKNDQANPTGKKTRGRTLLLSRS